MQRIQGEESMNRMQYSIMSAIILWVSLVLSYGYANSEDLPHPLNLAAPMPKAGDKRSVTIRPLTLASSAPAAESKRFITIDFDNVDIRLFIKYMSELTGKNFVVDKVVQDNVTIISPTKISVEEAYKVFESVLEVHGLTTVEAGSVIKIIPSARARSQNIEMFSSDTTGYPEDKVVTQLVPLKYSAPDEIQKVLTPLVSQASVIVAHAPSGMLIITETLSNIQKLLGIIDVLDVESREEEVAVISLVNASSTALAKILGTIYQNSGAAKKPAEGKMANVGIKVVPYERVNALIVLANSSDMGRVKSLIALLDTEVQRAEGNIHVYYLQNGTAVEMAKVLNVLPEKQTQTDDANAGKAAAISKNVQVMADEETNSLIITATKDEYAVLEDVIKKLDIPRRMVYLEALIMEVDADKSLDFGVEWAAGGTFSDATGTLATGFSGDAGYKYLSGISSDNPTLPAGYSVGLLKQGIKIGNVTFPNIAAVLRAVQSDSDVNVIATPQILTTDNKKAEISVGENVPFLTSKNTNASQLDYSQYEYKDVATKLSITPHINQADTLRLEIVTEVLRLKDAGERPTTFKRTATTTVILNDNNTVVIGGIIGQDATEKEWKIPLLGDIPLLGWLFKTHSTTNRKTNMFIFITPRIVRNPADAISVTLSKQNEMGDKIIPGIEQKNDKADGRDHAMKLTVKGYEKLQAGDLQTAKGLFLKALEFDPTNPFATMDMGVVYEQEGQWELAIKMYQAVITSGTASMADISSNPDKTGKSLLQIARESIERIMRNNNDN
jgi:general secretion pathway protein D